jgi:hypothetical protein
MENWIAWFAANRERLKQVAVLVGREAKVLQLTVKIARHLSRTENLISIHLDAQHFRSAMGLAAPNADLPECGRSTFA